jgi:16S rRNA (guanine527-N7)-methyltransferase
LADVSAELTAVLTEARQLGFLGPGPVPATIEHARGFARHLPPRRGRLLDLGSGGGVPGLVLASDDPSLALVVLDRSERRTAWLSRAVARLDLRDRVEVVTAGAEELGHEPRWRAAFAAVVARGFGPPRVTAECAAAFLEVGGVLVVSEPPGEAGERWDPRHLAALGLEARPGSAPGYAAFSQMHLCPARFPRRRPR